MTKDENKPDDSDLRRYQSVDGIDLRRARIGLWLAENRARLAKILTILLIVISASLFIFSTYGYIVYFLGDDPDLTESPGAVSPRRMTVDLELSAPQSLQGGNGRDLAIKIKNPNDKFSASFNYCWRYQGEDLACGSGFIFPQEEKYILTIGLAAAPEVPMPEFSLTDIFWKRVDSRKIPDWGAFFSNRINLEISDEAFFDSEQSGLSGRLSLSAFRFAVRNRSAYSYRELPLNILFFGANDELVAANRYLLSNFLSGEKRVVSFSLLGQLKEIRRTEIVADLNILEDGAYFYPAYQGAVK